MTHRVLHLNLAYTVQSQLLTNTAPPSTLGRSKLPGHSSTNDPDSVVTDLPSRTVLQAMPHIPAPLGGHHRLLIFLFFLLLLSHQALAVRGAQTPNTMITVPRPSNLHPGPLAETVPSGECDCRMIRRTFNPAPMRQDCRDWCIWRWAWY